MEPPQMLADATKSNGFGRSRFLGRIAINCRTKNLSSHHRIPSEVTKKINRKSQESLLIQQNETKLVEKNKEKERKSVNISFDTSIGSSVFEENDSNIVFWNPLKTSFAGHPTSKEWENPSVLRSLKPQLPTQAENQEKIDHEVSKNQDLSKPLTNPETVSMNCNETDASNDEEKLLLSSWGIPEPVLKKYHSYGIQKMFQWQAECLLVGNVLAGNNLVYSAPTSAGKTMVAELLILKRVLETKRKAIMILPFVSVAHEKVQYLKSLYEEVGVHVGGFLGSQSPVGGFKNVDVAVCTIEKGNNLVNRLIEENELNQLGIIVVDELHMVGDSSRGYLLELLLTKILFVLKCNIARKSSSNQNELPPIQIIGMSATLPNLPVIAKWLNASLYKTEYRPVPLHECVKINRSIFDCDMNKLRDIDVQYSAKNDTEYVIPLCLETVFNGDGVLVFCPTKMWCEKLADNVAREFFNFLHKNGIANMKKNDMKSNYQMLPINKEAAFDVVEQLKRCPAGLDSILQKTIQCGVAFHHAGLTFDEREIVESAFRKGIIKVLIATSTLSSGVNLPARRVIIRTVMFHGKVIDTRTYKQMVGRAGRKGVDIEGESILVCKTNEKQQASVLLKSSLPAVISTLSRHPQDHLSTSMKRAILEIIVSGAARKPSDVYLYTKCTLLSACLEEKEVEMATTDDIDPVKECIQFLEENEFITLKKVPNTNNGEESESFFFPTQLGSAVLSSGLSPDEGIYIFLELQRARRCFVLENELHVLYLVTPIYSQDISANIDWFSFYNLWEKLSADQKRVAELVGIEESFLVKAMHGRIPTKTVKQMRTLNIHKRFFTSLALLDLVQEMSLIAVSKKYKCNKGQLQSLQQSAATFAGMVTTFCARLGWTLLELIISQFQSRLSFGIQRELCDLVRISLLSGQQARILFSAGYMSVASLAKADPNQLEHILRTGTSFQSDKKTEDETEWEAKERLSNRLCIWLRGKPGMTAYDAAISIIEEAKQTIEQGIGGVEFKWEDQDNVSITNKSTSGSAHKKNRHRINFAKFLKINSQKNTSNETSKTTADNSHDGKGLPNEQNTQYKSIILSPPPGFAEKLSPKVSFPQIPDSKVYQTGITTSNQCDIGVVSEKHTSNIQLEENADIHSKRFSLNIKDKENTASKNVNPESGTKLIPSTDKLSVLENMNSLNNEMLTNATHFENQSSISKKSICRRKTSLEHDGKSSTNASLQVSSHKEIPFSGEVQKIENSTSTSTVNSVARQLPTKSLHHVKSSPAQMPKSDDTSATPVNHGEGQQLFTTSTPIDEEQLTLDIPTFVNHNKQITTEDACCTPVNNGKYKSGQAPDACSSTVRNIQPKQLISASPSCNSNNSKKQIECIEDGENIIDIIASLNEVDYRNQSLAADNSMIIEMPRINATSNIAVDPQSGTSVSEGAVLIPECTKGKDNVVDISTLSDVFADSFVVDTQVEELMDAKESAVQDKACAIHVPEKGVVEQRDDPPAAETSPVLFAEDLPGADEAATKTETKDNNTLPKNLLIDTQGSRYLDKFFSKEPLLPNAKENHYGMMIESQGELFPASNYERFVYDGDNLQNSMVEDHDLFNSYDDLRIPYESGQEAVFVCNANTKQEQLENEKTSVVENKPDSNINLSNDDLFTPLPVDIGISVLERQDKENNNFDEFLKPMSLEMITQAEVQTNTKTNSDSSNKEYNDFIKISEKHLQQAGSSLINQSGSRKRKQTFSCHSEKLLETKAKKIALVSKEKDSSPPVEQNLSAGCDCFPPTPPDNLFTESLQLSPIATPQIFSKRDSSLKKPSQKRRSPRLHNSNINSEHLPVSKTKNKGLNQKYCTRKRSSQLNNMCCENLDKEEGIKSPSDLDTLNEGTSSATMSISNQVKKQNMVAPNSCHLEMMDCNGEEEGRNLDTLKPVQPLCDASQHCSQNEFTIIDVCSNQQLFDTFILEWNAQKKYALSIGCEKLPPVDPTLGIGGNFMEGQGSRINVNGLKIEEEGLLVVGIAVCWNHQDSYYLSFNEINSADDPDDSLAPPTLDPGISITDRLQAVRQILTSHNDDKRTIVAFDVKSLYRVLAQTCSVAPRYHFEDPKIAAWMLDPGAKESSFQRLIYDYLPNEQHLLDGLGGGIGRSSLSLTVDNPGSGRYRATAESVLVWHLMKHLKKSLQEEGIFQTFQETEMPVVCTISRMELNGIGFSEEECEQLKTIMQLKLSFLEEKAYSLAGHPFSLSSIDDVSRVLYQELQLPVNGNPHAVTPAMPRKTLGTKRGPKVHFSTSKETLEKLKSHHPLPEVILEWRRITNSITKVVYPLQKAKVFFSPMNMHRIFGVCQLHTATGRISMFDPNLQNIPKDFNIDITDLSLESATLHLQQSRNHFNASFTVSMRHAFIPLPEGVLIAADYSQLELRMIAHLSQDSKLINILNQDCDVFRLIAAEWKNVSLEEVQNEERQQAKQICYGIIYGIGAKALGETLHVDENDAAVFIETFKSKYPGMKSYLRHLVEHCRNKGYIETITGRKRYLPNITSTNTYAKAQAERQAVNSTIQGSAADLVKKAMVNIEKEFIQVFPQSSLPHRIHGQEIHNKVEQGCFRQKKQVPRSGAFLLLQIHDELLYEVAKQDLENAVSIIQKGMESAMKLTVRLPVKLKCGHSWGQLDDFKLE